MRATASLALLALATGSTQAIFCFVKEKKCLPGVELSLDYDQIPELLGISVSKSSKMTATATQSSSVLSMMSSSTSSAMTVAEPTPAVNTSSSALPPTDDAGFLGEILPRVNATAADAAAATATSPTIMETTAAPAAPSTMAMPSVTASPASAAPAVAPAATAPMAFASPSSIVPDFVRDLIPRGDEMAKPAAYESVDHPVESKIAAPAYHAPELLPVPNANIESPRFNLTTGEAPAAPPAYTKKVSTSSHVAEIPSAYVKPASYASVQSSVVVTATYSSSKEEDTTTTVTEWTTVTPTQTIELSKSSSSKKEVPVETHAVKTQSVKTHAVETHVVKTHAVETHETALPQPSAPQTAISGTVRLTKTVDAYLPPPSTLSFSTVASYTAVQKPSEVPVISYAPVHSKAEIYPVPSNATSTQPASYVKPTEARPTVYVTPLPAMNSSMSRTQNSTRMQSPEQYTGAASANALDFAFVVAAGIAAMMVL